VRASTATRNWQWGHRTNMRLFKHAAAPWAQPARTPSMRIQSPSCATARASNHGA
jgi:hypothetical protein